MSTDYPDLLDATIQHLEGLKARGVRHIAVAPETLRALGRPAGIISAPPTVKKTTPISIPPKKTAALVPSEIITAPVSQSAIRNPQSAIEKAAAFAALRTRALACVKCPHLAASRKNVVFGVGSIDAQLMFVGEAPGADEDEQGEPFVGRAGSCSRKLSRPPGFLARTFTSRTS
jgi:uracil-DNA glycosylase